MMYESVQTYHFTDAETVTPHAGIVSPDEDMESNPISLVRLAPVRTYYPGDLFMFYGDGFRISVSDVVLLDEDRSTAK